MTADAQAQEVTIWSATLTPERRVFGPNFIVRAYSGYEAGVQGSLSDTDFVYRGTTYTISILRLIQYSPGWGTELRTTPALPECEQAIGRFYSNNTNYTGSGRYPLRNLSSSPHPPWDNGANASVSITVQPVEPDAPTALTQIDNDTQAMLSWLSSECDGGSDVTGHEYRLKEVGETSFGDWTPIPSSAANEANANSYTVPSLDSTKTYIFEVRAVNAKGEGPSSDPAHADSLDGTVCTRTAQVRDAIVAATSRMSCGDVTVGDLAAITYLGLRDRGISSLAEGDFDGLTALRFLGLFNNSLETLPAGVFDELTALTTLYLYNNSLSTLPAGVFDELTALTQLDLGGNDLSTLPAGVFDELTALTTLYLYENSLSTLPAGVFDELTALTTLRLHGNPGAPFSPTADALPDDGTVSFAGGDVTLDGSGSDGGPWGTNVTYSWAASGAAVTFDDAASATPVVTIPALADGTELTFTLTVTGRATNWGSAPDTDTATVTAEFDATAGICGRTEQVRDAIVALVSGVTSCALVTDAHLAAITGTLRLGAENITALAVGDFDGLTALESLLLNGNSLETLPARVFDELSALTQLSLFNNSLSTLPAGVFDELTSLTTLRLYHNSLSTLPAGVFDELTALTTLRLDTNSLETLPAGVFDGLTALTTLRLDTNSLETLPAGVFDGLTALTTLRLGFNSLSTLPAGVFDELTALTELHLNQSSLETLPAGVFDELTALTTLTLYNNSLSTLPAGVFDGLTALTSLQLQGNPGAPFSPTADALPDDGEVLDAGGDVTLDGSGSDGGPWGTNVTYSWAASGAAVTFDDAASATPVVTIPALADGTELTFTLTVTGRATSTSWGSAPDTDTATVTAEFDATAGICGRTEQVRTAIVALISGVTHCALVTDAHLAAITGTLSLRSAAITALAAGDFDGLTALTNLNLRDNSLSTLPAGVFDGLTALTNLNLWGNSLSTLPAGVFDELTALTTLGLRNNSLSTLPAGVFAGLTALEELELQYNSLSTLPAGVFEPLTALTTLRLQDNPGAPFSPTADALPDDGTVSFAGGDVTLDGSGSDGGPWGTNVTYSWAASGAAVTFDDAASATPVVTIPALADGTELTFTLTVTGRATHASRGSAPDTDTATVTAEFDATAGICGRTEVVRDRIINKIAGVTHCALVTDVHLAAITGALNLSNEGISQDITALAAGDFDGLIALTRLRLTGHSPLTTLPAGVFDELTALTNLNLFGNSLSTLPAGAFEELTALTTLQLQGNPGAPFSPTANALPDDGEVLDAGGDVTLDGSGSDGGPWGTNVTYSWAASGAAVTFDDAASATPVVTIPALAEGTELTFTLTVTGRATSTSWGSAPATDTATVTVEFDATAGICGRTEEVRDAIVALVSGVTHCALVTDAHLAAITGTLGLNGNGITALAAGDFDGLTALTQLWLFNNSLSTLPAGVFDELTALTVLRLYNNSLETLPAGVFDKLTSLTGLRLYNNSRETLPAGVFDELTALTTLELWSNSLSTLPAGVFDELTALTELWLYNNSLSTLPAGVFDELTALTTLGLYNNSLSTLPAGVFDELTALTKLALDDNSLSTLPAGVFDELTALTTLRLGFNSLSTLPAGVFDGLTALTTLRLNDSSLSTLPAGVFDGLTALTTLSLYNNSLSTLPAGVFDGLTALTTLQLQGNPGAPFSPTADALPDDGEVLDAGGDVTLDVSGSDGGPWGTNVTYSWAASGAAVTFDDAASATPVVTIPALANGTELTFTLTVTGRATSTSWGSAPDTDTATVTVVFDPTVGICGRTEAVRNAILAGISGINNCAAVTAAHLAAITGSLGLSGQNITSLAAGDFDGLTSLTLVFLEFNELTTLPAGVFDGLTALQYLGLGNNELTTLPAGVFDGLTALTELYLHYNELTELPAGVFDGLTALTTLDLGRNDLATLPAGVFDGLTALTTLDLTNNELATLPAGVFDGLTALTTLGLQDNPGAPFSPTADALPDDGTVSHGGGTMTLDGSGSDGGPWGTNVTYSWAASGAAVTFDDAASATPVVTIPALADGTELTFTLTVTGRATNTSNVFGTNISNGSAPDTDTATVTAEFDATAGICGRTEQVRTAIVALISGVTHCALVTDAHLAAITGTLSLRSAAITALAAGDFDGLTALTELHLNQSSLETLPAGVFAGLTALEELELQYNYLSTLPAGVFDGLTALTSLQLQGNPGAPFSPTADALPDDGTVLVAGGAVTLDGSGSDGGPWGTNVTYSWAASGATVTFDDAASATPVVTIPALADGTELTFTLTVTGRATHASRGSAPATDTATVTVQTAGVLVLNVDAITTDNTINIAEKAAGFRISGDTGSEGGVSVTVTVGTTELTAISADTDPATWSVSVASGGSYITGTSVDVTVSATKTGYTAPAAITRSLAVDLAAPTAPGYSAPVSLKVGEAIGAINPLGGVDVDEYGAAGLPPGLGIDPASGVIGGTPEAAGANTATATITVSDAAGNTATATIIFPAVDKGDQALTGFEYSASSVTYGSGTVPSVTAPTGARASLSYTATPAGVCGVDPSTGALTLAGAGVCEITATAAGSDDYNEATVGYTVTVQAAGALALNLGVIAGDGTVNIAEKGAGFEIGGDTGTETGVGVTVGIGGETLTTTSADDAGTATWTVSVPADASYITGTSLVVEVNASKTGYTAPAAVTRSLAVDLTAPTAPGYSAPGSLKVGEAIGAINPLGGVDVDEYRAAGLPAGLVIDAGGVIGGTPEAADAATATATVTVGDAAGNTATVDITFPAVDRGDQALTGFRYSPSSVTYGSGTVPSVTAPTGVLTTLSYSASPADVCAVDPTSGALTLVGAGVCEITATAAGSDDYNEATVGYTVTVQAAGALALNLGVIAGDGTVNIAEKGAGFEIGGDTGTEAGVGVTVGIGGETLTTTSADDAGTATWTVSVPADAAYISGASVAVEVSASKTGYTAPAAIRRSLAVDLTAPTAPGYSAPASLKVGEAIGVHESLAAASTSRSTAPRTCRRGWASTPPLARSAARRKRPGRTRPRRRSPCRTPRATRPRRRSSSPPWTRATRR